MDFDEVYALVARLETVRLLGALAAHRGWQMHHVDAMAESRKNMTEGTNK